MAGFSRAVDFAVGCWGLRYLLAHGLAVDFIPLHGFLPVIKSLRVALTVSQESLQVSNLILSFPFSRT